MNTRMLKNVFLQVSKRCGLFRVARYLTRRGLRILCYHGVALDDEHAFRPQLFITPETFHQRLAYLRSSSYPVLTLDEAAQGLVSGKLPDAATVITIDDGFFSSYKVMGDILRQFAFPATVYVTSYYAVKENPIFRLVVQYMFWKTTKTSLDLAEVGMPRLGRISLADEKEKDAGMWKLIRFGEEADEPTRMALARRLGDLLAVNFDKIQKMRKLHIMNREEIRDAVAQGIDIQLHTHRHTLSLDEAQVKREITDNKAALEPLTQKGLTHFCYPSGEWDARQWPWLEEVGVKSATTCELGINYPQTPLLGLKRFLDSENLSQIEFEAELVGYGDFLRQTKYFFQRFRQGSYSSGTVER